MFNTKRTKIVARIFNFVSPSPNEWHVPDVQLPVVKQSKIVNGMTVVVEQKKWKAWVGLFKRRNFGSRTIFTIVLFTVLL